MVVLLMFLGTGAYTQQGIRFETPRIEGFHPLDEDRLRASPLVSRNPILCNLTTTLFHDTSQIDFEKRQITFSKRDALGYTIWEYHFGELSDYLVSRKNYSVNKNWHAAIGTLQNTGTAAQNQGMKFQWELPVQYPTWAQRVLGKEPPKLTMDGSLEISIGFQNNKYEAVSSSNDNGLSYSNPIFDFDYQFGITGSVGRLINVNIRADKNNNFDMSNNLKNFKVEYKEATPGELEDEIIQEVILGYTGFDMPGTSLSGYSESHEGLVGIKIKAKVGPLALTTIASTEQGQSTKKSYNANSQSGNGSAFDAKRFREDCYFFLDTTYLRQYNRKYSFRNRLKNPASPPKVTELSVWRSFSGAIPEKQSNIKDVMILPDTNSTIKYERLVRGTHYTLHDEEGYIRFADSISLQRNQQIAIYLRTSDAALSKGGLIDAMVYDSAAGKTVSDTIWQLWVLRPSTEIESAARDPERFPLMWRNVYGPASLEDLSKFNLGIYYPDPDGNGDSLVKDPDNKQYFSTLLGLADSNNTLYLQNDKIFNKEFRDVIFPPYDTILTGLQPFNNPALGERRDSLSYNYGPSNPIVTQDVHTHFKIAMTGSSKKTSYDDLGWNIMVNTEEVVADGIKMKRDQDYVINYEMGTLDLISARAKAAEKVDVTYQSDALFVPDRKVFLGARGELQLPFISDKSFVGSSILFQSTKTNERVPRLDQEPFSKMLLDFNTHLEFEPEWMTTLVRLLPLIETEQSSFAAFDIEFAHSTVNPNTEGSAYIDDFEDSKQASPLGDTYENWFKASPPYSSDSLYAYPPAWDCYWFNPLDGDRKNRVFTDSIKIPEVKRTVAGASQYTPVLRLHTTPAPNDSLSSRFTHAWAGVMTPISQSFANKKEDQYFELLVKVIGGFNKKGKLLIQMGNMREDVSSNGREPNGKPDREDTALVYRDASDDDLDRGWDLILDDKLEQYYIPAATPGMWDSLGYGNPILGVDSLDPSKDNWDKYWRDNYFSYRSACRRQNDEDLTSEDINYDGAVQTSLTERYYQFTIDLSDAASALIDTSAKLDPSGGWRKYRIPLRDRFPGIESILDSIDEPSWANITMVRLIWTDFDSSMLTKENQILLSEAQFVGNQWISIADSLATKCNASVINTRDDNEYLKNLSRKIYRPKDQLGDYEAEQSLRLNFVNLRAGDTALVSKNLQYQNLNLSGYERLTMLVYGKPPPGYASTEALYNGNVHFVFRFGSDDSTYYEYNRLLYPGWNNDVSIDLKEISSLKDRFMVNHPDSAIAISNGTIRVQAPVGRQPNFSRIKWMALGFVRAASPLTPDSLEGEVWVDEMKLEGVAGLSGWASRVNFTTKWADLLSLQAQMDYENADFRRMTETKNTPDNTQVTASAGATIGLDKFLPQQWGLSIPAGVSVNGATTRPQLKNETDVYLVDPVTHKPDGFSALASDAASSMFGIDRDNGTTLSELYQTSSTGRTYYTSYKKNNRSDNILVSLLADRISADAKYSTSIGEVRYGVNPQTGRYYAKRDTNDTYGGSVKYDLSPVRTPSWSTWSPLKHNQQKWLPSTLKGYTFSLLPSRFTIDLAAINYGVQRQDDSWRNTRSLQYNYTANHGFSLAYAPISPLSSFDYTFSVNRDLIAAARMETAEKAKVLFRRNDVWKDYYVLWGEKSRSQHAGFNLNPQLIDWLPTSGDYSADYAADLVSRYYDQDVSMNLSVKSALKINSTLQLGTLLGTITTATEKTGVGGLFSSIKKGFDQVNMQSISFSYSAGSNLRNNYVSTNLLERQNPGLKNLTLYQLGLKGRSFMDILRGEMDDRTAFGGMGTRQASEESDLYRDDSRTVDQSLRISTNMTLKIPFELSLSSINLNWVRHMNIYPDSSRNDTTVTFPDFSVTASTPVFNKLAFISKNLQGVSCNSSFSYRVNERYAFNAINNDRNVKVDWMPLFSLSGTLKKWPISLDYRHNLSFELGTVPGNSAPNKDATLQGDEFSLHYDIDQSSKFSQIKLLTWTIPVKGKTSIGLKITRNSQVEIVAAQKVSSFSIVPNLSYVVTDNVSSRAEYTFQSTNNNGNINTLNEFRLTITIRL